MLARAPILAVLAVAAAPQALADDTEALRRTWLERLAISAADKTCNLFSEGERFALASGIYQAEGELLRAGKSRAEMQRLAAQVTGHAQGLGCNNAEVVSVAATVRDSYRQFARTNFLEYPSPRSTWGASRSEHDRWAASQTDKTTGVVFGLRRIPGKPDQSRLAVAMPARGVTPAAAQLVFRDPEKMSEPWLGSLSGKSDRLAPAPRGASRIAWAGKVMSGRNEVGDPIWIFNFDAGVIDALEQLDPREAIQVNFLPAPRAKDQATRSIIFEIGDFRAARAFSMIPKLEDAAPVKTAAAAH